VQTAEHMKCRYFTRFICW